MLIVMPAPDRADFVAQVRYATFEPGTRQRAKESDFVQKIMWSVLTSLTAVAAAWAARKAVTAMWSKLAGTEGPVNPADRSVTWGAAAGWAVLAGIAGGVARVVGKRGAAVAWQQVTGETPPGLEAA